MRKIVAGLFISLDGVTESPERWNGPFFNDEMGEAVGATIAKKDTLLLGRRTFEEFAAYWPTADPSDPFTDFINNTPKVVVSNTLGEVDWQPTTVIGGDVIGAIRALKEKPGQDVGMTGSTTLVRSLLKEGLIDELGLMVHPLVLGTGKRLFDDVTAEMPLTLLDSQTFKTGVVSLTYGPAHS
jgi:dihydrofolate reductase